MARIVFLGLTVTSSWGNGHATTYRAIIKALTRRGHEVTFLERDVPWYADNRDFKRSPYCRVALYRNDQELKSFTPLIQEADAVIVGSYVPDGIAVGEWVTATAQGVTAFYDIDTPVTLKALEAGRCEYLNGSLASAYDIYFSFSGGPALERLRGIGARDPVALYCSVDPEFHRPAAGCERWALGYLGTYAADRQRGLERMLLTVARNLPDEKFAVAGSQYPADTEWPDNVEHIPHLAPNEHCSFYCSQRFALNLTRADMRELGYSPSVRLFEAAACGVPIISDSWPGLETFFVPDRQILVAETNFEVERHLRETSIQNRNKIAAAARAGVLKAHSSHHRAQELERSFKFAARKVA